MQNTTDPAVGNRIHVARIAGAEVVAAIMRKVRTGEVTVAAANRVLSDFKHDFTNQYQIVEMNEAVILRAMSLIELHKLRGYDGVQLAAALELNDVILSVGTVASGLTLVSADDELNEAAIAEGLIVDDPRTHLDPGDRTP